MKIVLKTGQASRLQGQKAIKTRRGPHRHLVLSQTVSGLVFRGCQTRPTIRDAEKLDLAPTDPGLGWVGWVERVKGVQSHFASTIEKLLSIINRDYESRVIECLTEFV